MNELDTVVLNKDLPEHGIEKGDIGVIVHTYDKNQVIEIEFVSGAGETLGVVTMSTEDVRPMNGDEILHVRELHTA
jgi:hypothetical protein